MNLAFVRSFVALAETGSFRAAAERLQVSQPTISQHIRKFEEMVGAPLIERSHSQSRPTRQGRNALPLARSLLEIAERIEGVIRHDSLVIGASGNIASYYLAREIRRFSEEYPDCPEWRLVQGRNPDLVSKLVCGEVDVAATEWEVTQDGIVSTPWLTEPMVVILPPDHPLASRKTISRAEFLGLPLVGGESGSGTGTLLREALGSDVTRLRFGPSVGSTEAVKSAVKVGLGCSIVLRGAVAEELEAGSLSGVNIKGITLRKTFFISRPSQISLSSWSTRFSTFVAN